jgi:trehalose 6-phosphate phosphatase
MTKLPPPPTDLLAGAALFLDFDGTLVELAATPESITVPPRLAPLLERLRERLQGRLAIVSGRAIADLEKYVPTADIGVSGSHGLELRLPGGEALALAAPPELHGIEERIHRFAGERHGLLVESKPAGVALHYRQAPHEGRAASDFMEKIAREADFIVQRGNMVIELRPRGADKGDAVQAFLRTPAFAGARPVFVGDDLTDEHAFAAAERLGGAGILVGPERDTHARYRLESASAVIAWLETWA